MPTNLYGPGDNFNLENSHVIPALIRKFHDAKVNNASYVDVWGTGMPKREFLYVDDLADASVFLMNNYNDEQFVNVGVGNDVTIRELSELIKKIVEFEGELRWDASKPDGTPRKLLDIDKLTKAGWKAKVDIEEGIKRTYQWFVENQEHCRQ